MEKTHLPQGAEVVSGGVRYSVWAPARSRVEAQILTEGGAVSRTVPLLPAEDGCFRGIDPLGRAGDLYKLSLDGGESLPPPGARFLPLGVHGPAAVVDPLAFVWQDAGWQAPAFRDLVLYELHLGTFSPAGTFRGAIERLTYLRELGVNAIEIMPIAEFPGERGWGYDGVQLFAPARCYGSPDDFRALVDAAHLAGIAVVLDVVYNHLGPAGNYLPQFSPHYFEHEDTTPWGDAINFGRAESGQVREFYRANLLYWMREFHIDGFRLDATHAIADVTEPHILSEMAAAVQARGGFIIAEDERNEACIISERSSGGFGFNGVWADDFHHAVETALIDASRYKEDFAGELRELIDALQHGWTYRGKTSRRTGKPHGTECAHLPQERFIFCISNHDQVGNRAFGERLNQLVKPATYRAASALLLLAPYTPMLFMGQEWAASTPFLYFTDHEAELGRLVEEGRRRECQFAALNEGREPEDVPSPQAVETFERSKLDWEEIAVGSHAQTLLLYRTLLQLRREEPAFRPSDRCSTQCAELSWGVLAMRAGDWLVICDLRGSHNGPIAEACDVLDVGCGWQLHLSTNETRFGGDGASAFDAARGVITFGEPGLLVFRAR